MNFQVVTRLSHSNVILKLDTEKTYDWVEWPFLLFMLRKFGFQKMIIDLKKLVHGLDQIIGSRS